MAGVAAGQQGDANRVALVVVLNFKLKIVCLDELAPEFERGDG